MKKCIGPLLLILLLLAGCSSKTENSQAADSPGQKVPVEVTVVDYRDLEDLWELSGEISAAANVTLAAKLSGTVAAIEVATGDRVQKGDLLLQLESKEIASQVRQAEAALAQAQAALVSTRDVALPKRLQQVRSALEQAELHYNGAADNLERIQALYEQDFIARVEYENALRSYQLAEAQYSAAAEQLRLEEEGLERELAALEAQVNQARAALDTARTAQANTQITAPISGTVTMVTVGVGQEVAPGTPLLTIVDFSRIYVETKLTERLLEVISSGQQVDIVIPATGATYAGVVDEISLSPLPGTKSYLMKVAFDPGGAIRIGQQASLQFIAERADNVLAVPRQAVLEDDGRFTAFVVDGDRARQRELQVGAVAGDYIEVVAGLQPGELLVTAGQHYLEDRSPVQVVGGEGI